jgi:AcrR family transcriptional regulator
MSPRTQSQWEEIREKSKEKILNAAISLFSSLGYFSTSVSKIAKKAGVSKGLLYNYFESKDDLLTAIVNKTFELLDNAFATEDEFATPREELKVTLIKMFDLIENHKGFLKMLIPLSLQVSDFGYINKIVSNKYDESTKKISRILSEIGYKDPEGEARLIIANLDGIMYQYLTIVNDYPFEEIKQKLINKYCDQNNII